MHGCLFTGKKLGQSCFHYYSSSCSHSTVVLIADYLIVILVFTISLVFMSQLLRGRSSLHEITEHGFIQTTNSTLRVFFWRPPLHSEWTSFLYHQLPREPFHTDISLFIFTCSASLNQNACIFLMFQPAGGKQNKQTKYKSSWEY